MDTEKLIEALAEYANDFEKLSDVAFNEGYSRVSAIHLGRSDMAQKILQDIKSGEFDKND